MANENIYAPLPALLILLGPCIRNPFLQDLRRLQNKKAEKGGELVEVKHTTGGGFRVDVSAKFNGKPIVYTDEKFTNYRGTEIDGIIYRDAPIDPELTSSNSSEWLKRFYPPMMW